MRDPDRQRRIETAAKALREHGMREAGHDPEFDDMGRPTCADYTLARVVVEALEEHGEL